MSFTRLIGQEAVKKRLAQEITGNPCHASVFTGVKGIGKHEFAHEYAKALLCSEPTSDGACGHCNNCRYIEAKTHPDFIILEPEKGSKGIKVTDVREKIISDIKICPQISKRKVYLIESDALNEEGQNALLKSLEEPPENIMFILICEDPSLLLPTVMSRTVEFKLQPYTKEEISSFLTKANEIHGGKNTPQQLKFIADFSSGIIGRAIELLDDEGFLRMRNEVMDMVLSIGRDSYTTVLNDRYIYFEENKDLIDDILLFVLWTLGDLDILIKNKASDKIMNPDKRDQLLKFLSDNPGVGVKNISAASSCVTTVRKRLELNVNYMFAISDMLLGMKKELQG